MSNCNTHVLLLFTNHFIYWDLKVNGRSPCAFSFMILYRLCFSSFVFLSYFIHRHRLFLSGWYNRLILLIFFFSFFLFSLWWIFFFTITSFFVSSSFFFLRSRRTSMLSLKISLKKGIAGTWLTLLFPRPWFNPRSNSISWWPPWWVLVPISSDASFQMNSSRLVRTKYVTPPLPSPPQHTRGGDPEGLAKGCAPFPVFSPSCLATFFPIFYNSVFPFFLSFPFVSLLERLSGEFVPSSKRNRTDQKGGYFHRTIVLQEARISPTFSFVFLFAFLPANGCLETALLLTWQVLFPYPLFFSLLVSSERNETCQIRLSSG